MSTDTREALAALPLLPEPSAHEVFVYGRREKLVTRADVADELACKYRENDPSAGFGGLYTAEQMQAYARAALATQPAQPLDMVLHCPACGMQHIDAPDDRTPDWKNEPHRSHLCHGCGHIWRPADVPTNGVLATRTKGKADSPIATQPAQPSAQSEAVAWLVEWKAHGYGPQWWGFNHTPGKNATWCSDANNAIRFARKEDAERMRLHIISVAGLTGMHEYERSVSVTEHMWEGPCRAN